MLTRLGGGIFRARWMVLGMALLLVAVASVYGFTVFSALKSGGFEVPTSDSSRAATLIDDKLKASQSDVVVLLRSDTLSATDPQFEQAVQQIVQSLQGRPEVAAVTSYYSTHSAGFISTDGHETFALIRLADRAGTTKDAEYDAVAPLLRSDTLQVSLGGNLLINQQINSQIGADLERAEMVSLPIVLLLSLVVFGGLVAAALPLLVGGIAIAGALAALHLLTNVTDVSIFSFNIVTMLGLGLAIDYALFIITRFREELAPNERDVRGALVRTMATAGRTVLFSGLTVSTSLLSLLLFPEYFLRSMGLGAIAAVLVAMLAALTVLPAMLALLGQRVNALSVRRLFRRAPAGPAARAEHHGAWYRLSQAVMRYPIPVAVAVVALLLFLGSPFLRVQFNTIDPRVLPATASSRQVYVRMAADFPQQGGAQIAFAVTAPGAVLAPANLAVLDGYVRDIKGLPGVAHVDSVVSVDPSLTLAQYQQAYAAPGSVPLLDGVAAREASGDTTLVTVATTAADHSAMAEGLVRALRALPAPAGFSALVGGQTAYQMDLFANLRATIPAALLVMALAIFVVLFLMTGSVVMPLKAIALNILSLSATFGALVFIFQEGHLSGLLGFQSTGAIESTQPVLIFAIAFGLSMDYEVFLLSRIKERYDATGDHRAAVASGLQRTGWLITSAALLLAVVLGAFATSSIVFIKMVGVGLAIAVVMDATLVRTLLVPATMRLLGRWNWWAPVPLRWLWHRVGLREAPSLVAPVAVATPAE